MGHRIMLVTDAYPPMIGGADLSVQALATGLAKRGHVPLVVTAWQRDLPEEELRDGVQVHRVRDLTSRVPWVSADPYKHVPPPFPDPEAVARMRRLVRRLRPDVVHSYGWLTYSAAAALVGTSVPLVLSFRDYGNFCAVRTLLRWGEEPCSGPGPSKCLDCARRQYGAAKGAVAVAGVLGGRSPLAQAASALQFNSHHTQETTWRHMLAGRTRVQRGSRFDAALPSFRDFAPEEADPAILAQLPEEPFVLYVGALRRAKGIAELLSAYERLEHRPPLVLVGTPETDTPPAFPPGVQVVYSMPHGTVMAAWDRALFGVFPSRLAEPLGTVVHEAMSRGRPVIGTTPGGHGEMIEHERSGLLVPSGDVDALAAAMARLIADASLRERMGAAARERSSLFTAQHVLPQFEALFDAVVAAARERQTGPGGGR